MKNYLPQKPVSRTTLNLVVACVMLGSVTSGAFAVDPLYQWNFNSGTGANTGTGTDGALTLDVGLVTGTNGYAAGSFTGTGVSGVAGDYALNADNAYDGYYAGNSYSPITNAAGISNLDMSTVSQFTITMWVKRTGSRNVDLFNIGSTTTPGQGSDPGISIGLDGNWANGIRVGINGHIGYTGDLWAAGTDSDWVFLAIAYDGANTAGGTYNNDATMNGIYGTTGNASVITGGTDSSAIVATGIGIHDGSYWNPAGAAAVGSTATMFLANDGANADGTTNGFRGSMDDIRIYSSLLSVSDIETIRLSALTPVPEPRAYAFAIASLLGVAIFMRRRRMQQA